MFRFAVALASVLGAAIAIGAGCTVLTNDALPDDAGVFVEAGDAGKVPAACATCLAASCAGPQALCLTNASCIAVLTCAGAASCDSTCRAACACNSTSGPDASADAGASGERLHHAFTACNDALLPSCAADCASEGRGPTTLPGCATAEVDAGPIDSGTDGSADAGPLDAAAPAPGPNACAACAASACAPAIAACGIGTECAAFLACSSGCVTRSCVDDCASAHATGKVAAGELAACTAAGCQKDCEL